MRAAATPACHVAHGLGLVKGGKVGPPWLVEVFDDAHLLIVHAFSLFVSLLGSRPEPALHAVGAVPAVDVGCGLGSLWRLA